MATTRSGPALPPLLLMLLLLPEALSQLGPRYARDSRCPGAMTVDPNGTARLHTGRGYRWASLSAPGPTSASTPAWPTIEACKELCCADWMCLSLAYVPAGVPSVWRGSGCTALSGTCCVLIDSIDPVVPSNESALVQTARRAALPPRDPPPYGRSSAVPSATVDPELFLGIPGDEFPITWGSDGRQYTGAGDNKQAGRADEPVSFFAVAGSPPTSQGPGGLPAVTPLGPSDPMVAPEISKACSPWYHPGLPNVKSSGVLSVKGTLYWAVSCFNYGDNATFNRQRYGPAWIATSRDNGATWNATATLPGFFPDQLAAPRFVQYGRDYAGALDEYVYAYFPSTTLGDGGVRGSAFFSCNDQMLLGRVHQDRILERSAWQFAGAVSKPGEGPVWAANASQAQPVFSWPLRTSVQQANYHPGLKRFVFANWAWVSMDGSPKPDHSSDERHSRTSRQRTWLTLWEAPQPWGPFRYFGSDDNWRGWDGSSGAYTPVFPPAWIPGWPGSPAAQGNGLDFWMVSTQCCGTPPTAPTNHYGFDMQRVRFGAPPGPVPAAANLSGRWVNHDSAWGNFSVDLAWSPDSNDLVATGPGDERWTHAVGKLVNATSLWLHFTADAWNNRTGTLGPNNATITFERIPAHDPPGWTQTFSRGGG